MRITAETYMSCNTNFYRTLRFSVDSPSHKSRIYTTSRYTFHTQRFTIYRKFVARFTPIWLALIVTSYNKTVFNTNHRTRDYMKETTYSRTLFSVSTEKNEGCITRFHYSDPSRHLKERPH